MRLIFRGVPVIMYYTSRTSYTILDSGYLNGMHYLIIHLGSHPTAYIGIDPSHKLAYKSYTDASINLNVHGGVTYSGTINRLNSSNLKKIYWYGWDYSHAGDFLGYDTPLCKPTDKKWTFSEIFTHVVQAIEEFKLL